MRRHSPYNYAFDNPIKFIDPDGMSPRDQTLEEWTDEKDEEWEEINAGASASEVWDLSSTGNDEKKIEEIKEIK